jgi:hypothetical protein
MPWEYNDPSVSKQEEQKGNVAKFILGNKFPQVNKDFERMFSLYRYLEDHTSKSDTALAAEITQNGKPLFTAAEIANMRKRMKKPFLGNQTGGVVNPGGKTGLDLDASRSKFWDRFIRRIVHPISSRIPSCLDGFMYYLFILYSLEQMDLIGPFISTGLDTITLSLPMFAEFAELGVEKLLMLAPIPYAGLIGEIAGMAVSIIFLLVAFNMNVSRKHFGTAFKNVLEMVPFIGDVLEDGATSFELGAERLLQQRERFQREISKVSPHAGNVYNYYVPDLAVREGNAPTFSVNRIQNDVENYVIKRTGIDEKKLQPLKNIVEVAADIDPLQFTSLDGAAAELSEAAEKITKGATAKLEGAVSGAMNKAAKRATNAATGAVTGALNKATAAAEGAVKNATNKAAAAVEGAVNAAIKPNANKIAAPANKNTKKNKNNGKAPPKKGGRRTFRRRR